MRTRTLLIVLLLIGSFIPLTSGAGEKPLVVTSIAPLAAIVQDAFGDSVEVVYIIPLGADPHEYQLTASQIELLRQADVIVTTGGHLPVEKKIAELKEEGTITSEVLFIDDYKAEGFRYLSEYWYNSKDNSHGIWLDPHNAMAIAQATEKALEKTDPYNAELYRKEFKSFRERVGIIVEAYKALVMENRTAVIQMPSNQYAIEWLGIKAVASIKPEEEVPALGVDELVSTAEKTDLIVYGKESPDQLKEAAKELAVKSGKSLAEITVFWKDRPYTEVLIENSAAVIKALGEKPPEKLAEARTDVTRYVVVSIIVGLVLGTALGVILKK
ncbi:ABC-type manganese/zinc transport system, periplasmic component [Thermococcus onnurineus NA1]|uniref:ABC-type manganese/zinc transport system, periplasmic component n=1 Tax=Thermococcus onnurineus (strain NA1) TaxID=523850 RepID=B6YUP9_THEON|nr:MULTISPECIES: zinc ABC transporter substrate-binding protein [Thermococcus]ACJ16085.1 ABC-type manganese/zinc transport system, periplasmic component [Thermococcus onnurineus NA1]NJE46580.1 ABC transporter substrate-binding protein [Thermococcus sp. GR7]NJE79067.1 ABC transporter substrate-binding protein [Thermococcus sp. GR4]NJF23589.1 ABC transporter substrate-binding protein [Thermococcus sp. GR5]